MKVTFISPYYPPFTLGGAEISTSIYIQNLPKEIEPVVVTSTFQRARWIQDGITVVPLFYNVEIKSNTFLGPLRYCIEILFAPWLNTVRVLRYLRNNPTDIVHIIPNSYLNVGIIVALSFMKVSCVVDIRDFTWICMTDLSYPNFSEEQRRHNCFSHFRSSYKSTSLLLRPFLWSAALFETSLFFIYTSIVRYLVNGNKSIIVSAISPYTERKLIQSGFRADKISVISNIVSEYTTFSKRREKIFTYAGRIEKSKGIWDIVYAFLESEIPDFALHIYGTGTESRSMATFLKKNNIKNINFHEKKPVEEIIKAYQRSYAMVSVPLRPEPLGRFLLDSFLTQTPLITSMIGGSAEYIRNGENGILVAPGNKIQLVQAFQNLVNDKSMYERIMSNLIVLPEQFITKNILESRLQMYSKILTSHG